MEAKFMRLIISITLIFLIISACSSSMLISKKELRKNNFLELFDVNDVDRTDGKPKLDRAPMYPNGSKGIYQRIEEITVYPISARENNIEGKVLVEFIIDKDGYVREAKIIESVSSELDKEALRVVLALDRFYPGLFNGKPVRVSNKLPISFQLN